MNPEKPTTLGEALRMVVDTAKESLARWSLIASVQEETPTPDRPCRVHIVTRIHGRNHEQILGTVEITDPREAGRSVAAGLRRAADDLDRDERQRRNRRTEND